MILKNKGYCFEMERQRLDACVKVEQVQIKLSGGSGDNGDISNRPSDLPLLHKQMLQMLLSTVI